MCILSTLSALNSIENYYYHIEFRMDSMHIGTQALVLVRLRGKKTRRDNLEPAQPDVSIQLTNQSACGV